MAFNSNYCSISKDSLQRDSHLRWSRRENEGAYRSAFSKDRDRVLYSKCFLRMRGKTQVFMLQENDYIRTRMTHSLEVNQIAKTIAKALGLNLDLTEAIALGHDAGHTPFGHIGERTLKELIARETIIPDNEKGFKHNLQALRLFCELEKGADFPDIRGLNLTKYVLWGIAHHSSVGNIISTDASGNVTTGNPLYDNYLNAIKSYWSLEGLIVAIADEIAQRHHDIEDSLLYGVVNRQTIVDKLGEFAPLFSREDKKTYKTLKDGITTLSNPVFSSVFSRLVVNVYVVDTIKQTKENLKQFGTSNGITNQADFARVKQSMLANQYKTLVSFSNTLNDIDTHFQDFLKTSVLSSYQVQAMDGKGAYIVRKIYEAFKATPSQLPDTALRSFMYFVADTNDYNRVNAINLIAGNEDKLYRCIADYIGGMTDNYAYSEFNRLYGTKCY